MISRVWLVSADAKGFLARKYVQGHDGMRRIEPQFDDEAAFHCATKEEVHERLRTTHLVQIVSEKTLMAFQNDYPGTLEVWW